MTFAAIADGLKVNYAATVSNINELRAEEDGHRLIELRFGVEADAPPPRWLAFWPWFAWPALAVALFGIHPRPTRCP